MYSTLLRKVYITLSTVTVVPEAFAQFNPTESALEFNVFVKESVFPNPCVNVVNVSFKCKVNTAIDVYVYDHGGHSIRSYQIQCNAGTSQVALTRFEQLAKGEYMVRAVDKSNASSTVIKVVKQ